ncbi:MAG: transcriptional repressor LexA [Desulfobulbaceae bacterium]|nr:transcriptional repressor LexA [Desulfobulbaceae bacterium]
MEDLTRRQLETFNYIIAHQKVHGIAPTVREICLHFGLASPGGVHRILRVLVDKGYVKAEPGEMRNWRPVERPPMARTLPLIGEIAAGMPIEAIENSNEELLINPAEFGDENCFGLRVKGDSMVDMHILAGDIAVIRPCSVVNNGDVAAVLVDNMVSEATLKVFYRRNNSIELLAANSNYLPLVFPGEDQARITVVGKLAGVVRRIR